MIWCSLVNFLAASWRSSLYGGADFLHSIIACRRIFFNPAFSAPAHKSGSAPRSPDVPAGSAQRHPVPARPACRSICCAPAPRPALRGEIGGVPFWVWERRGLLAAPWCGVFGFSFLAGQSGQRLGMMGRLIYNAAISNIVDTPSDFIIKSI